MYGFLGKKWYKKTTKYRYFLYWLKITEKAYLIVKKESI